MRTLSSLLASLLVLLSLNHGARAEPIRLAIDDWCPYICSATGPKRGILVDVVEEAFASQGKQVQFVWLPFAREIIAVRKNQVHGMVGLIKPAAPDLVYPDEPVISTQFCFFTHPSSNWSFEGFGEKHPEVMVGIVHGEKIDDRFEQSFTDLIQLPGDKDVTVRLIQMLQEQRFDTFIQDQLNVRYTLAKGGLPPLRQAGCVEKKNEYVPFSPHNPQARELARLFSLGMRKLKQSGRFEQIVSSYLTR